MAGKPGMGRLPLVVPIATYDAISAVVDDPDATRRRRTLAAKALAGYLLVGMIGLLVFAEVRSWNVDTVWQYELVATFGAAVGIAEILARYRDSPSYAVFTLPSFGYIFLNALASIGALLLIFSQGWQFGADGGAVLPTQLMVAGFGSMALFRSSLLTVKVGTDDVGVGPSLVLSVVLAALDRSVDRLLGADRAGRAKDLMSDVDYRKAKDSLPSVAMAVMQNLDPGDKAALKARLSEINEDPLPDDAKRLLLGLALTQTVGPEVLRTAKEALGDTILQSADPPSATVVGKRPSKAAAPSEPDGSVVLATRPRRDGPSDDLPQTPQTPGPGAQRSTPG
jgi:hypothetical protein